MNLEIQPKHKKLTRFLCQELLYEYVSGTLEGSRRRDMDEFLPTDYESQREFENLNKGLLYTQSLSSIQVSPRMRAALLAFEPAWKKRVRDWTLWSSQRGWRMLPYAFLISAAGLGLYVTQPWSDAPKRELVLAESEAHPPKEGGLTPADLIDTKTAVAKTDAGASATSTITTVPLAAAPPAGEATKSNPTATNTPVVAAAPAVNVATNTAQTTTPPATANVTSTLNPANAKTTSPSAAATEEARNDDEKRDVGVGKGSILRGQIEVNEFASAWPAVRDKIISLGGKAAGNVELGWLRRADESYFHFSLPESNYGELQTFLKTFGPVRINKERHPRVMPAGQIRIILTVKDSGKNEGAAEAP